MKKRLFILLAVITLASNSFGQSEDIFKRKAIEGRMLSVAKWQLANPKHELFDWTNGAFYAGVFAAYENLAEYCTVTE